MITRRNYLIGAASLWASKAVVPWLSGPNVVRAGTLMTIRGKPMSVERNYYGWCDRGMIGLAYKSGALRGQRLLQLIDEGVLNQIPRPYLAYDIARWGTGEMSWSDRVQRAAFFGYYPLYSAIGQCPHGSQRQFLGDRGSP
jgi:hypothetical protein